MLPSPDEGDEVEVVVISECESDAVVFYRNHTHGESFGSPVQGFSPAQKTTGRLLN
jgi:hypothetical protein